MSAMDGLRRRFSRLFFVTTLLLLRGISLSNAQAPTDLQFHRFQPKVAPDLVASTAESSSIGSNALSAAAAQQIQALQLEKAARTPAQRKIDSNLLYTSRMLAGEPAAPSVPYLYTGVELDSANNLAVEMVANVTDDLLDRLTAAGVQVLHVNRQLRSIRAMVPPQQLEPVATMPEVVFISPRQRFATRGENVHFDTFHRSDARARARSLRRRLGTTLSTIGIPSLGQGSVETEGDIAHRTFDARGAFGVTGSGVKIGVLSDGVTSLALSQALGDLPPTCGTPPCVTVLPGQSGSGDEGTAMLEIIHDMAPGAALLFATAANGIASFAQNIRDLRTAGCDILVDDVFYFVETPFQDGQTSSVISTSQGGVVTQAVNDVVTSGALYFSATGNEGSEDSGTSGTYESDFSGVPGGSPLPSGKIHSFGTTTYDGIISSGLQVVGLWWADPLGASSNDYDLFVLNNTGVTILAASTNLQNGTQDPLELIASGNVLANNRLVVLQNAGASDRFFHLGLLRGTLAVHTAGETHGHSAASGAYTVAAAPASLAYSPTSPTGPFPDPYGPANQVELFSSDGPRRIFFSADSTPITPGDFSFTGGQILDKPDITAADGVSVTGVGGFGSPFYGTSAAAPAAAAIAALLLSAKPTLTPPELRTALTSTAVDVMGAGFDRDSGHGIVMAWEAIQSLGITGYADPEFKIITANENPGNANGVIEPGEGASLVIALKNTGGVRAAAGISASLNTSTSLVYITLPGITAYADMAAGADGGSNLSPLTFTLDPAYPCGQAIDFTLTLAYAGGPPRALNFSLPTGEFTITSQLGSQPPATMGIAGSTGSQINRINRTGVSSTCGSPKSFPGVIASGPRTLDSYSFTACQDMCLQVAMNSSAGASLFESGYSPSFDPGDIGNNYKGDSGLSSASQLVGIETVAGAGYTVVVNDVSGLGRGNTYTIKIPACAINCNVNHLPIAVAHDVTVIAASSGDAASASINDGSSDPDGDAITLSQSPAGPYSLGTMSVLLTVVDSKGATAQTTANVTVRNPGFAISASATAVTVSAGASATQHIIFTPDPGIGASLTFACSGLPRQSSCTFSPSLLPAGSADSDIVLTIHTTSPSAAIAFRSPAMLPVAAFALFGCMISGVSSRRHRTRRILLNLLVVCTLLSLISCGGGTNPGTSASPGTPKERFVITVTGTSGNVSHATTFDLTVQ